MSSRKYLLAVAIGPVQDFIAAARKTRDLAYGSHLLSECSKTCARAIAAKGDLIFPFPADLTRELEAESPFAVVNKILAEVTAADEAAIAQVAAGAKKAVQDWLIDRYRKMENFQLERLRDPSINYNPKLAHRQVAHVMEFYAAWVELANYPDSRRAVESKLAARKALRDFPWHEGEMLPKSNLDGGRETVIEHTQKTGYTRFRITPGETLDSIGLLKRMGRVTGDNLGFESTHDIAAKPYIRLAERAQPRALAAYRAAIDELKQADVMPFSYSHLFHEEIKEKDSPGIHAKISAATTPLLNALPPATPYYGIFIGDGDHMGRAISSLQEAAHHRAFSRSLSGFAQGVRTAFKRYQDADAPELVFAGGDDVLAFLPLHIALEVMLQIRTEFGKSMAAYDATFSAGLAVCHAMDPLSEARAWAANAEASAKDIDIAKDAFCITVVPRSGAAVSFRAKWAWLDKIGQIARLYVKRQLTLSLSHEFRRLLTEWEGASSATRKSLDEHLPAMALAIADKKQTGAEARKLIDGFMAFDADDKRKSLEALTNCLYVARPFAKAMREAYGREAVMNDLDLDPVR